MTFLNMKTKKEQNKQIDDDDKNNPFDFSLDEEETIPSPFNDIKNIKKFPFVGIGAVMSIFPLSDEEYLNTYFFFDKNVAVTLAINLDEKLKVGKLNL